MTDGGGDSTVGSSAMPPTDASTAAAAAEPSRRQEKKQHRAKGACWHCGSEAHRARACPQATCRACRATGHDISACPERRKAAVERGDFKQQQQSRGGGGGKSTAPVDGAAGTGGVGAATANTTTGFPGFTYAELFAGIGGFRVALDRLGGTCVFASEIDKFARAAYTANFGDVPAGDVTLLDATADVPAHDVLCGGFPCQPFSSSGKRDGFEDAQGRGVLFREICRIAAARKPKALLLENVRGLLTHDDGRTLRTIVEELDRCGYHVSYNLVNAVDILPQERARVFLVGLRKDLPEAAAAYRFAKAPALQRGVGDILECVADSNSSTAGHLAALRLSAHQVDKVRAQPYTRKFPSARFLSDTTRPAKTLQSSYASYMVGSQFVRWGGAHAAADAPLTSAPAASTEDEDAAGATATHWRKWSPREAARLMGFPESFKLCAQRPYKQLGNAVAPPVIAVVAAPLLARISAEAGAVDGAAAHDAAVRVGWRVARDLLLAAVPPDSRLDALRDILAALPAGLEDAEGVDMVADVDADADAETSAASPAACAGKRPAAAHADSSEAECDANGCPNKRAKLAE